MARTIILFLAAKFMFFHYVMSISRNISDQSALRALKSQIHFDPNNNFLEKNWSASSSVCSWMGVLCRPGNDKVTALNISGMGLIGTVPPHLGNLSSLVSLDISNNNFSGNLPEELAQLQQLQHLDARSNNFSGTIPSFFSSLSQLQFLRLAENRFSGSIPSSFSNISKLEYLDLSSNFLQGSIPADIGHLHYLIVLCLEFNRLTGPIPPSILNLSLLKYIALTGNQLSGNLPPYLCYYLPLLEGLYLSRNEFDGPIPQSIDICSQLQVLSLDQNQFSGNIPREVWNLTLLTNLYLGANNFQGSIAAEIGNLQRLQVLGFGGNSLSGSVPETIFNISALVHFSFANSLLSGSLPSNMGKLLPNLEEFYMGMNNFTGNIPESITNASRLTILDLSYNSFTGPIPTSLGNLASLQSLGLENNNLMTDPSSSEMMFITSLTNCRKLKLIAIGENPLGGALPSSTGNLSTSLQIFAAYKCKVRGVIPENIGNLSNVFKLSLLGNDLSGYIPTTLEHMQALQVLALDNNNLAGSLPNNICNLANLGYMSFAGNQLSGPVPSCIGNISSLRNLYLDSNNFYSNLPPSLWALKDLVELDVSSNSLNGSLPPEIGGLNAATLINLSRNGFSGDIPSSLDGLQSLINFSLAQNQLVGSIPDSLGQLVSLELLDLSHNKLTGPIPQSLQALTSLQSFNVSFNQLTGQIPSGGPFVNFTASSFMSNGALCGDPRLGVLPCTVISNNERKKRQLLIIFIVLGVSSLVLSVLGVALISWWRNKKKVTFGTPPLPARTLDSISYYELVRITNGFIESNLLGTGSYGSVYKGTLDDGTVLAVKVFDLKLAGALDTFATECEVLCRIVHRNLTKVVSCCSNFEMDFKALVLEYMPNGSLEKWLHSGNHFLNIWQRLNIMMDVAVALDYLHNGYYSPVIHRDVKPSNVLLDKDMTAHVCDFGIAKLLGARDGTVQTNTLATIGYIASEYGQDGLVSTKCDVYSFGIMLMETFTGRRPSDDMFSGDMTLKRWVQNSFPSATKQVVDYNLLKHEEENLDAKMECLSSVLMLALNCTATSPDKRMKINDVVSVLQNTRTRFLRNCDRGSSRRRVAALSWSNPEDS